MINIIEKTMPVAIYPSYVIGSGMGSVEVLILYAIHPRKYDKIKITK